MMATKTFEVMTSSYPIGTLASEATFEATTLNQGNPDKCRNDKLWNIGTTQNPVFVL